MKNINKIILVAVLAGSVVAGCSKKELDVKNPNNPTPDVAATETGIQNLALGAVYRNGFNGVTQATYTGSFLGSTYFFLGAAYHELMADVISAEAANNITKLVGVPDYVVLDDGTKFTNSAPAKQIVRLNNSKTKAGSNMFYYEWAWMYFLNDAVNNVLYTLDKTTFSGDSVSKKNAYRTWAYFWKGYVYSHIGGIYYAGLAKDTLGKISNQYLSYTDMMAVSNANFDKAIAAANAVTNATEFNNIMKAIIPTQNVGGKGGLLTPTMWIHNCNTMKARNTLVTKRVKDMTTSDWNNILTLTANGINSTDLVITARSSAIGNYMSASSGSAAALTTGVPTVTTYKISERLIQDYPAGDKRFSNDFAVTPTYLNQKGGFTFSTRWRLLDSGGITKTYTSASITSRVVGAYELYIAGTYEENELMKAEANIKLGNIATGLASVDAVRTYQNAGVAAVSGVITDPALAYEELRKERRVGLIFRQVSYYDARRWGVLDDVTKGGGRTKCVVLNPNTGALSVNATINYNFPDYWDVPDDETVYNPPSATSAPVKNPN